MRHPNIVLLLGVTLSADFNLSIITELCEQKNLSVFFKKFRHKTPADIKLKILLDVARALYYLHSRNPPVLHRDLKPENIFLTQSLRSKLGDFG